MKKTYIPVALSVTLAFFLIPACSSVPEVTNSRTLTVGNQVGNLAPGFSLKDLNGNKVSLNGFSGRPVVLTFWSMG